MPQNKYQSDPLDEWVARRVEKQVANEAEAAGLPPSLITRQHRREVGAADPRLRDAVISGKRNSSAGAIGPMQLMPGTARELGVDPYKLDQNVSGGVRYMEKMTRANGGDLVKGAAAYNAGLGRVQKSGGVPKIKETQDYVQNIFDEDVDAFVQQKSGGQLSPQPRTEAWKSNTQRPSQQNPGAYGPDIPSEMLPQQSKRPVQAPQQPARPMGPRISAMPGADVRRPLTKQIQSLRTAPFETLQQGIAQREQVLPETPELQAKRKAAEEFAQKPVTSQIYEEAKRIPERLMTGLAQTGQRVETIGQGLVRGDVTPLTATGAQLAGGLVTGIQDVAGNVANYLQEPGTTPNPAAREAIQQQLGRFSYANAEAVKTNARKAYEEAARKYLTDPNALNYDQLQQVAAQEAADAATRQTMAGNVTRAVGDALPAVALGAVGGLPAALGTQAAMGDIERPLDTAVNMASTAVPMGLTRAARPMLNNATQAMRPVPRTLARTAGEMGVGAAGNVGQSLVTQPLLTGKIDPNKLAEDAAVGAAFGISDVAQQGLADRAARRAQTSPESKIAPPEISPNLDATQSANVPAAPTSRIAGLRAARTEAPAADGQSASPTGRMGKQAPFVVLDQSEWNNDPTPGYRQSVVKVGDVEHLIEYDPKQINASAASAKAKREIEQAGERRVQQPLTRNYENQDSKFQNRPQIGNYENQDSKFQNAPVFEPRPAPPETGFAADISTRATDADAIIQEFVQRGRLPQLTEIRDRLGITRTEAQGIQAEIADRQRAARPPRGQRPPQQPQQPVIERQPLGQETPAAAETQTTPVEEAPQQRRGRLVNVNGQDFELTSEQEARWQREIDEPWANEQQRAADWERQGDKATADKIRRGAAMRLAAVKRDIVGSYTGRELQKQQAREETNYQGKPVSVDINGERLNGKVAGNAFGRTKIILEDGRRITVSPDQVGEPIAAQKPVNSSETQNLTGLIRRGVPPAQPMRPNVRPSNVERMPRRQFNEYEGGEVRDYYRVPEVGEYGAKPAPEPQSPAADVLPFRRRPPAPAAPRRPLRTAGPSDKSAVFPREQRDLMRQGRVVEEARATGTEGKGPFGRFAQQVFRSTVPDGEKGITSFYESPNVKGALGLDADASAGETRQAFKNTFARMMKVNADEVSLTQVPQWAWDAWMRRNAPRLGAEDRRRYQQTIQNTQDIERAKAINESIQASDTEQSSSRAGSVQSNEDAAGASASADQRTDSQSVRIGEYVRFTEPAIVYENGQPVTIQKRVRGRITKIYEDGSFDLKRQDGGYTKKMPADVTRESGIPWSDSSTASQSLAPKGRGTRRTTEEGRARVENARQQMEDAIKAKYDTPRERADAIASAREAVQEAQAIAHIPVKPLQPAANPDADFVHGLIPDTGTITRDSLIRESGLTRGRINPALEALKQQGRIVEEGNTLRRAGEVRAEEVPQPGQQKVRHDNPAISGKPIIAETADGRFVVANPENKTGVSIVKGKQGKFSSTQVNLPDAIAEKMRALGEKIPDADLTEDGRETESHITVKYGLHDEDPAKIQQILAGEPPVRVRLGKTSLFENEDADVVKVDVDSPDLQRLNKKIADAMPHTDTHPDYKPHATIAYVKPGTGKKYAGLTDLEGQEVTLDRLLFSSKNGVQTEIKLQEESSQSSPSEATQPAQPKGEGSVASAPRVNPAQTPAKKEKVVIDRTRGGDMISKRSAEIRAKKMGPQWRAQEHPSEPGKYRVVRDLTPQEWAEEARRDTEYEAKSKPVADTSTQSVERARAFSREEAKAEMERIGRGAERLSQVPPDYFVETFARAETYPPTRSNKEALARFENQLEIARGRARQILKRVDLEMAGKSAAPAQPQPVAELQSTTEQSKTGFDADSFNQKREEVIRASREAGNVHLDKVPAYVETMRGKEIYYAHDPKVRGIIRTVDNRGSVYVDWSDQYSADKENASPTIEKVGRKTVTVFRTSLGPTDLKDYVLAKPVAEQAAPRGEVAKARATDAELRQSLFEEDDYTEAKRRQVGLAEQARQFSPTSNEAAKELKQAQERLTRAESGQVQMLKPELSEKIRVENAAEKEKIGKAGLTPTQEQYLRGKIKEAKPMLAEGRDVTIPVPGDGRFTLRGPQEARALEARLDRPKVTGRAPLKGLTEPRQTPLSRDFAWEDTGESPVKQAIVPLESVKPDVATDGNIATGKKFVTDGRLVIRAEGAKKLPPAMLKKNEDSKVYKSDEDLEPHFADWNKQAKRPLKIEGVMYMGDQKTPYAFLTDAKNQVTAADAAYLRAIVDAHAPDEIAQAGKDNTGVLVFRKNGQPVAALMPMRTKNITQPGKEIGTKKQLEEMREVMGKKSTPDLRSSGLNIAQAYRELSAWAERRRLPDDATHDRYLDKVVKTLDRYVSAAEKQGIDLDADALFTRFEGYEAQLEAARKAKDGIAYRKVQQQIAQTFSGREQAKLTRDADARDTLRSPLSNLNYIGTYEKLGGAAGKAISEAFKNAQAELANNPQARNATLDNLAKTVKPYQQELRLAGKPQLANYIEAHLDAVRGGNEPWSGLANFLTKFNYYRVLAYNPRSAAVNWLQPFQTLWPHLTTREFTKVMADARRPEIRARLKEIAEKESGGQVEGVEKRRVPDLFGTVSDSNRIVGHLAGELMADKLGLTGKEKARMAADWAAKVEFDNGRFGAPPLFRKPGPRVFLQFKGYTVKNLERIWADVQRAPQGSETGKLARISKMVVSQVAVGGVRSISALSSIPGIIILGTLAKTLEDKLPPEDKHLANKMAEGIYFGAPALLEQDLSSSMMLLDAPFGKTPKEKALNAIGGPTVGLMAELWTQKENYDNAKTPERRNNALYRVAKAVTPYTKTAETVAALAQGKRPMMQLGRQKVPMTALEAAGYGLMGTPLRQTRFYEDQKIKEAEKKARRPVMPRAGQ